MRDRLDRRGILAIWYPSGLDTKGILTAQYVRTLRSLGFTTEAYRNDIEFLILAFRDPTMSIPKPSDLDQFLTMGSASFATSAEFQAVRPRSYPVAVDPDFVPITDQKPFLAGNVRYILSINQVFKLFGMALGALGVAGAAVWWALRRRGNPQIPARSFSALAGLARIDWRQLPDGRAHIGSLPVPAPLRLRRCSGTGCDRFPDAVGRGESACWPAASPCIIDRVSRCDGGLPRDCRAVIGPGRCSRHDSGRPGHRDVLSGAV